MGLDIRLHRHGDAAESGSCPQAHQVYGRCMVGRRVLIIQRPQIHRDVGDQVALCPSPLPPITQIHIQG